MEVGRMGVEEPPASTGKAPIANRSPWTALRGRLGRALSSCATEADLVQVLYGELHPVFGYYSVNLHVLEREGWYHSLAVDHGVLQDVRRRQLAQSTFADHYRQPTPSVLHPSSGWSFQTGRGPGVRHRGQTAIWMPVLHRGEPIGSVIYHLHEHRHVPSEELALLEQVHSHLAVLVSNAVLNELTRNQALSLGALNAIARALSNTHDEEGVVTALTGVLSSMLRLDRVQLVVPEQETGRLRVLSAVHGEPPKLAWRPGGSPTLRVARQILAGAGPCLETETADGRGSAAWMPVVESGRPRGVLSIHSRTEEAYEGSTIAFLQQVADQVALALRNAWSYSALEAQSRRLEVVNTIGRRLASCLDRWSIMGTLREELARHIEFDVLSLATVTETPQGPVAEGYVYDSGEQRPLPPLPLVAAGPSREAYESGHRVLIRQSPWARSLESSYAGAGRVVGQGVVLDVTRPGRHRRLAARSIIWVPVSHGEQVIALLSVQSYRARAFDGWHGDLLEDVATHVGLALANAEHFQVARTERHRLEALHLLELGVAGATDESQIAEAVARAVRSFLDARLLMLCYLDPQGRVTGYCSEGEQPVRKLPPVSLDSTRFFKRLMAEGETIAESVPHDLRHPRPAQGWPTWGPLIPCQVLCVPLFNERRVVGALSAQRLEDRPFQPDEVQLLESAAPVVSIALRTVKLLRANELALAHSSRLHEVAGLAGHELAAVLGRIAEQVRAMLGGSGAACWAFDVEGRVTAEAATSATAARSLRWSGRTRASTWRSPPREPMTGVRGRRGWTVIPLWYADRLVGALGAVHAAAVDEPPAAVGDFGRHAAIAIENARLAGETRGRIHTLEAVAGFADLDIPRPERARAEMCRLIENALESSDGAVWLLEGGDLVRAPGGPGAPRLPAEKLGWTDRSLQQGVARRLQVPVPNEQRHVRHSLFVTSIVVEGRLAGMLTADAKAASPVETRRLMAVLAGQAALVLGQLALVAARDLQTQMLMAIMTHSPVGVVLEDAKGQVIYANPEIERIYGVTAAQLAGRPARWLVEHPRAAVLTRAETEPEATEVRLQETGTTVHVRRVAIPSSEDLPARVLVLHQDVTRERALMDAKDLILRAIGHEVRSPAAAMRSTIAGLLQWGTLMEADQRHQLVVAAYEQSERLLSLVENQLLIAKLETWRFEPNRVPVSIGRSLEQVLAVLRSRHGTRVDAVESQLRGDLPDALCEPTHLDQVLTNLVGNALEYSNARIVRVAAEPADGWLEVTVSDDGRGLPSDQLAMLFAKTAPAGQNRSRSGLGLGLYLCRLVIERSFGGRIWLEPAGPGGTNFKFTVPAVTAGAAAGAAIAASTAG